MARVLYICDSMNRVSRTALIRIVPFLLSPALAASRSFPPVTEPASQVQIEIVPEGASETTRTWMERIALERVGFRDDESGGRFRVLDTTLATDAPLKERQFDPSRGGTSSAFRILIYDYSLQRLLEVTGDLDDPSPSRYRVQESDEIPSPSPGEYEAAVAIIRADPEFSSQTGEFRPYPAMPGVLSLLDPTSSQPRKPEPRIITVGLLPKGQRSSIRHEIVGVNLASGKVIRYPAGAPRGSTAGRAVCAPWNADQATSPRGTRGKTQINVTRNGEKLWSFDMIRPASSSGARGSGIDIQEIYYRGKRVAGQMHMPILNVRYVNDVCGPYRDWTWQEGSFSAYGNEVAPGILRASEKPLTIFESNRDAGNFRGVAVYREGADTVVISETEAGWYRYKSEFRFRDDGTLRPVWGFAGVQSSCTCRGHVHHGYFRFDLDAEDGKHNRIQFYDGKAWVTVPREGRFHRDNQHRLWRVIDSRTGSGYMITPGPNDNIADGFGRGDIWALQFNPGELDDSATTSGTAANIDAFIGPRDIYDTDVVLWYAVHFYHNTDNFEIEHNGELGPVISPISP